MSSTPASQPPRRMRRVLAPVACVLAVILAMLGAAYLLPSVPGVGSILSWRLFSIPSGSMQPTVRLGETVIADMTYYAGHAPARGDVAVYPLPGDGATYMKRIVALEGDRIRFEDGRVLLNGKATDEPYADLSEPKAFYNTTTEWTVPPGHVFVAGDNRHNSTDSRVASKHGPVPVKTLQGRVMVIVFSADLSRIGTWVGSPGK